MFCSWVIFHSFVGDTLYDSCTVDDECSWIGLFGLNIRSFGSLPLQFAPQCRVMLTRSCQIAETKQTTPDTTEAVRVSGTRFSPRHPDS